MCTASIDEGISPYEVWCGSPTSLDGLLLPMIDHVGEMKIPSPAHKPAPRGAKCILLKTSVNHPHNSFRLRDFTAGSIFVQKAITWYRLEKKRGVPVDAKPSGEKSIILISAGHRNMPTPSWACLKSVMEGSEEEPKDTDPRQFSSEDGLREQRQELKPSEIIPWLSKLPENISLELELRVKRTKLPELSEVVLMEAAEN